MAMAMAMAMVVCNSWPWNPHRSPIQLCSLFFFYFVITLYYFPLHSTALSFNFTNFNETTLQNGDIIVEGKASFFNQAIQITPTNQTWIAGRASYKDPLKLGDIASGTLVDFNTHFSFVIDSQGNLDFADGLAFFLLPHNSPSKLTPAALAGGLALFGFIKWKKSKEPEEDGEIGPDMAMDNEFDSGIRQKKFSYAELFRATNNFADEQKLGEGGFGGVYKGFLRELNSYVAVKRISKRSKQGIKEYASEVNIISRLRHRNLVQLLGWCHDKNELLLVYEFMENGSLDNHLFKENSVLTWAIRYKIAQGLASALLYLHEGWEQCVVHRDVKSSNMMLDSNFNVKLGDFGLARFVDHGKDVQTTNMAGTRGYMAPECLFTGKASKESDVYSFGIVALEIACGRKPFDWKVPESQTILVEWVWDLYATNRLLEVVDPKIYADFVREEMECLMIVGLWCAHPDHNLRPSIRQAIHVLNFEAPLPILPTKMPVPTYITPPVSTASSSVSRNFITFSNTGRF
ncbi:hypothetical protein ACSBR2_021895 [Camellia fascicularis]